MGDTCAMCTSLLTCLLLLYVKPTLELSDPFLEMFEATVHTAKRVLVILTEECCACQDCVEADAILTAKRLELEDLHGITLLKVIGRPDIESKYGVTTRPSLLYFRHRVPALYDGPIHPDSIMEWISQTQESSVKSLSDESFEHLTQAATGATTGNWLVIFYSASCINQNVVTPILEGLSSMIKLHTNVATVDSEHSPQLVKRFAIRDCPTVLFFRLGKMYKYGSKKLDIRALRQFTEILYKNMKAHPVPFPQSPFDMLIEAVVAFLEGHRQLLLIGCTAFFTVTYMFFKVVSLRKAKVLKKE